jgi:Uncharacterised nucleotidyltransferase
VKEQGLEGSFWPSERQKLLLRTAFGGGEASAETWRRLRPRLDLDRLELGSFPLLPLVHRQLERLGIDDPYLPRLAGIRRRTWYLNHVQLERLAPALAALEGSGVEPIAVGGWQFPARYYGDVGLRLVEGLEVLVRPDRADAAARALAELGYAPARDAAAGVRRFVAPEGRECTLHRRLAQEFSVPERGVELDDLWERTSEIPLGQATVRVLGPADELVRTCLAGARAATFPNVLWLADALAVVGAEGATVEWERVVRHARLLRSTLRLRDALVYLRRELDAWVPDEAIGELEAPPARRRERLAHREAGRLRPLLGPTPRSAVRFLHVTSDRSLPAALAALPGFLRDELGVERRAQVPLEVVRRMAGRERRADPRRPPPRRAHAARATVEVE